MSQLFPCELSTIADQGFGDLARVPAETVHELYPECVLPAPMRDAINSWPLNHNSVGVAELSLLIYQAFKDNQGLTKTEIENLLSVTEFENKGELHPLYQLAGANQAPDSLNFRIEMGEYSNGQLTLRELARKIDTAVSLLIKENEGLNAIDQANLMDMFEGAFMTLILPNMFTYDSYTHIPYDDPTRHAKNEQLVQGLIRKLRGIVKAKTDD